MAGIYVQYGGREYLESDKGPYRPCDTGIHVCGADRECDCCYTAHNITCAGPEAARELFDRLQSDYAASADEPGDFCVDLMVHGDLVDDFPISHQMFERMKREAAALSQEVSDA